MMHVMWFRRISCPIAAMSAVALFAACSSTVAGGQASTPDAAGQRSDGAPALASIDAAPVELPCIMGDAQLVDPADGTCYMLFSEAKTWQVAQGDCLALSGTLAVLSQPEKQAVVQTLSENHPLDGPDLWLGATDVVVEGTFVWLDGEPMVYENWREGEPNDNGPGDAPENCVVIEGDTDLHEWDDRSCVVPSPYICERRAS